LTNPNFFVIVIDGFLKKGVLYMEMNSYDASCLVSERRINYLKGLVLDTYQSLKEGNKELKFQITDLKDLDLNVNVVGLYQVFVEFKYAATEYNNNVICDFASKFEKREREVKEFKQRIRK